MSAPTHYLAYAADYRRLRFDLCPGEHVLPECIGGPRDGERVPLGLADFARFDSAGTFDPHGVYLLRLNPIAWEWRP